MPIKVWSVFVIKMLNKLQKKKKLKICCMKILKKLEVYAILILKKPQSLLAVVKLQVT